MAAYASEPDIDEFTSETGQTEWNLAAHLGPHVVGFFPGYSYDIDITKPNFDRKRPDIIIHTDAPPAGRQSGCAS